VSDEPAAARAAEQAGELAEAEVAFRRFGQPVVQAGVYPNVPDEQTVRALLDVAIVDAASLAGLAAFLVVAADEGLFFLLALGRLALRIPPVAPFHHAIS
jgi:hypothetical protein